MSIIHRNKLNIIMLLIHIKYSRIKNLLKYYFVKNIKCMSSYNIKLCRAIITLRTILTIKSVTLSTKV